MHIALVIASPLIAVLVGSIAVLLVLALVCAVGIVVVAISISVSVTITVPAVSVAASRGCDEVFVNNNLKESRDNLLEVAVAAAVVLVAPVPPVAVAANNVRKQETRIMYYTHSQ